MQGAETLTGPEAAAPSPVAPRDARESWQALLSGAVAVAAPWRKRLRVSGSDAVRWLNGMVTNNTAALAPGAGNYSFLLNNQGRIQGDLLAFRVAEGYVLETSMEQSTAVAAWLDRYIIMDDVLLEPETAAPETLLVAGVHAAALLRQLGLPVEDTTSGPDAKLLTGSAGGDPQAAVTLYRDPALRVPAFWLWCSEGTASGLLETLHSGGAGPCHPDALEWLRIASGVPLFGRDITARDLPQETGQTRALHFQKGCYLGQEIVERIHSRGNVHRGLAGFELSAQVSAGTPVLDGDSEIGVLTSVATLPGSAATGAGAAGEVGAHDRTVGFGIVRMAAVVARKPLTAAGDAAMPQPLPFL